MKIIESLTEKCDKYEDEYACQSNRASRSSHEELQLLYIEHDAVTRDVKCVNKELYSLIEDLEGGNVNLRERCSNTIAQYREIGKYLDEVFLLAQYVPVREDFETEQRYLECLQYHEKIQAAESERFEEEYQRYEALIADNLTKIEQQLNEPNQEAKNLKLAS